MSGHIHRQQREKGNASGRIKELKARDKKGRERD